MVAVLAKRPARILHSRGVEEDARALAMSAFLEIIPPATRRREEVIFVTGFRFRMNMACAQPFSFRDSGSQKRTTGIWAISFLYAPPKVAS